MVAFDEDDQQIEQFQDFPITCDPNNINCNDGEKQMPSFHFPPTTEEESTLLTELWTTINNNITKIWNATSETTISAINKITSTTESVVNTTISEIIPLQTNITATNSDNITLNNTLGILENASGSSVVEMMLNDKISSGTLSNNTNVIGITENVSNSSIMEIMRNGTLSNRAIENATHLPEVQTVTGLVSSTSENLVSILNSTTQKAVTIVTEKTTNGWNAPNYTDDHNHQYHTHDNYSHNWLFVLLGIIIAVLILIGIVLLLIYIRYRRHSFLPSHNYYEISPMKESCSPLPPHVRNTQEKECNNELYSQYST